MKKLIVYNYRRDLNTTRVCDLGCKHSITFHEAKKLYRHPPEDFDAFVSHLHYTHGGRATIQVAYDYQGRRYELWPSWDGPGVWKRSDGKTFWIRPVVRMDAAFTLDNRLIP